MRELLSVDVATLSRREKLVVLRLLTTELLEIDWKSVQETIAYIEGESTVPVPAALRTSLQNVAGLYVAKLREIVGSL
jgi:hypothetical protein